MSARRFSAKNQTLRTKKRKRNIWRYILIASFFILIFFGMSIFSFSSFWTINTVRVVGANEVLSGQIRDLTEKIISEPVIGFFSGRNSFFVKTQEIKSRVQTDFLQFVDVSVSRDGFKEISIELKPRIPAAQICSADCFSVDENGLIFDIGTTSKDFLRIISTTTPVIGDSVISAGKFKEMEFFVREIGLVGLPISNVAIETGITRYGFNSGGDLLLDDEVSRSHVLEVIKAIVKDGSIGLGTASFMKNLDYIEIGVGNKLVYKMKGVK